MTDSELTQRAGLPVDSTAATTSAASPAAAGKAGARAAEVDMLAVARSTQTEGADFGKKAGTIKLVAPAKVNLFLGIGERQANGYHQALSILHALNLHDVLYLRLLPGEGEGEGLTVKVDTMARGGLEPLDIPSEKNIAHRAIVRLAERLGRTEHETIELHIEKHIPSEGGLGGGSSDAAAALVGAAQAWGVPQSSHILEEVARELGSDVAFFLHGGCGCYSGTGDMLDCMLEPMSKNVVLIKPDQGVSTAAAYRKFDEDPQFPAKEVLEAAHAAKTAHEVPLFNNLAPASEQLLPQLAEVRTWAQAQPGVESVLLCGSGSTTFAVCSSFEAACELTGAARHRGWWARTTALGKLRSAAVGRR